MPKAPEGPAVQFIDRLLPRYDVESSHSIRIAAPRAIVYQAASNLDMSHSLLIRLLFRLRGLPASALRRDGLVQLCFKPLQEEPDVGFALGVIGQFWTPHGRLVDFDPQRFSEFADPGYAKAVWCFSVEASSTETSVLTTLTRVQCLDRSSRRKFRLYWRLVGPFSGLIRSEWLRVVRKDSEALVPRST